MFLKTKRPSISQSNQLFLSSAPTKFIRFVSGFSISARVHMAHIQLGMPYNDFPGNIYIYIISVYIYTCGLDYCERDNSKWSYYPN